MLDRIVLTVGHRAYPRDMRQRRHHLEAHAMTRLILSMAVDAIVLATFLAALIVAAGVWTGVLV